jgi:hypothetical protein
MDSENSGGGGVLVLRKFFAHKVLGNRLYGLINILAKSSIPRAILRLNLIETNQAWPGRRDVFENFIKDFKEPVSFLEIGTWFAEGSTQILFNELLDGSRLVLVDAWTPYVSNSDVNHGLLSSNYMDDLAFPAMHNTIKKIFMSESLRPKIGITLIRGKSGDVLSNWKDETFDVIYIDGSHYYRNVLEDIELAKRLCKKSFSIVCGDDLEKLPTPVLIEFAKGNLDVDFIDGFHPGVLLAVAESFGSVNMKEGFWSIYCIDGVFTTSPPIAGVRTFQSSGPIQNFS